METILQPQEMVLCLSRKVAANVKTNQENSPPNQSFRHPVPSHAAKQNRKWTAKPNR